MNEKVIEKLSHIEGKLDCGKGTEAREMVIDLMEQLKEPCKTGSECEHTIGTGVDEDGCCSSCGEDLNHIAIAYEKNKEGEK